MGGLLEALLPWRRGRAGVRVRRGSAPSGGDGYVIAVANGSRSRPLTVTRVWLETAVPTSVFAKPLPAEIPAGGTWETWIEARELPPGTGDATDLVRVALADGRVLGPD